MIHHRESLSLSETSEYIKDDSTKAFMKKFSKLPVEKAKELRKKLQELSILKINEKHISKIIDLLPEDKEALNKIVQEANLDENETNSIIHAIKDTK
jgi:DNA-directed RNA polymerase subunit F